MLHKLQSECECYRKCYTNYNLSMNVMENVTQTTLWMWMLYKFLHKLQSECYRKCYTNNNLNVIESVTQTTIWMWML